MSAALLLVLALLVVVCSVRRSRRGPCRAVQPSTLQSKRLRASVIGAASPLPPPAAWPAEHRPPGSKRKLLSTATQLQSVVDAFNHQTQHGHDSLQGAVSNPSHPLLPQPPMQYRPSAIPPGKGAPSLANNGRLSLSSVDSKLALLERLHLTEEALEVGVEQLREWLAEQVLQPLLRALQTAHVNVSEKFRLMGQAVQLQPLDTWDGLDHADYEPVVSRLVSLLPSSHDPTHLACLEASVAYQRLTSLVRGDYPPNILPATPPGYLVARIHQLAEGHCMPAFTWNGGGEWKGRPWSPELPTDSALVFYLFASYLAAPQWLFQQDEGTVVTSATGTLYLGKPPNKLAEQYVGVLSSRPPSMPKGISIVGTQLGGEQPVFSLVATDETLLVATGSSALLQALVLFLHFCNQELSGCVGGRHIQQLQLSCLLQPSNPWYWLLKSVFSFV